MSKKNNVKNRQKAARKAAKEAAEQGAGRPERGRKIPLPNNYAAIVIDADSFNSLQPDNLIDYVGATEKAGGVPFQHVVLYRYSEGVVEYIVHTRDNATSGIIRKSCASMEDLHALLSASLLNEDAASPKRSPVSTSSSSSSSSVAVELMRLLGTRVVEGLNPNAHVLELRENEGIFLPEGPRSPR